MLLKILAVVVLVVAVFCIYVASRPKSFRYERNGLIAASPEKIFPYLRDLKRGMEWSFYEKIDPNLRRVYSGPAEGMGSVEEFDGNKTVGSGRLEITKETPNSMVEMKLEMYKPFKAKNFIQYTLTPEGAGTRFSYAMAGDNNFLGKLVGVIIDCEKMLGGNMDVSIQNLRAVVESKK